MQSASSCGILFFSPVCALPLLPSGFIKNIYIYYVVKGSSCGIGKRLATAWGYLFCVQHTPARTKRVERREASHFWRSELYKNIDRYQKKRGTKRGVLFMYSTHSIIRHLSFFLSLTVPLRWWSAGHKEEAGELKDGRTSFGSMHANTDVISCFPFPIGAFLWLLSFRLCSCKGNPCISSIFSTSFRLWSKVPCYSRPLAYFSISYFHTLFSRWKYSKRFNQSKWDRRFICLHFLN